MSKEEALRIYTAVRYATGSVALDGEKRGNGQRRRINQILHGFVTIDAAIALACAEHSAR